ncbi:MAG: glucose 1-dehydrogenase [Gemmatimonadota bacterium]
MSTRPLDDSVVLVTGATSGIGLATAEAFAAKGSKVVLSGRRTELGEPAAQAIRHGGGDALFVQTDMTDDAQVDRLVSQTVDHYGRLDIAFNNAGIEGDPLTPLHESSLDSYARVFDTNVRAVLYSMMREVPAMLASGGGAIVNNASIAGLIGFPGASIYCASKHAVIGLTKSAALEYAAAGIRVNAVAPAVIKTGMFERFASQTEGLLDHAVTLHPIGRFGESPEVAQAVVWLSSPENSFTTGVTIPIDGGFTAQ